jgi:hypothetical protein
MDLGGVDMMAGMMVVLLMAVVDGEIAGWW